MNPSETITYGDLICEDKRDRAIQFDDLLPKCEDGTPDYDLFSDTIASMMDNLTGGSMHLTDEAKGFATSVLINWLSLKAQPKEDTKRSPLRDALVSAVLKAKVSEPVLRMVGINV